ncbi:MAG: tetratricopeptide repeat protein [Comamonadaceae bacterium]|nr:MAG: tetratricopeptide repeat protein [Comamonadaceae bacterium]
MQDPAPTTPKTRTPAPLPTDPAFEQALGDHLQGHWQAAEAQYRSLLADAPGHAPSVHFLGVLRHQQGDAEEGNALVQQSLRLQPDHADWHNTWGNMLAAKGRGDEAAAAFVAALECDARHADAWNNLGAVLLAAGQAQDAVAALRNAVELRPALRAAHQHLGDAYQQLGDSHAAALSYCAEYVLRPKEETQRDMLGIAYSQLGLHEEAAQVYAAWLADEPGHPIAAHLLAASQGKAVDDRVPADFLQRYFDGYAETFEHKLVEGLEYSVPPLVHRLLADKATPVASLRILDAGCGTGLCGLQLKHFARQLSGVDLSEKSLAVAHSKGVYDSLHRQDILDFLGTCAPAQWDLLVAADVLIYFGDLVPFVAAAHAALAPGGRLLASFEVRDAPLHARAPSQPGPGYVLQPSGRYSHSESYLLDTLRAADFTVQERLPIHIRKELGRPVQGLLLLARKAQ